AKWHNSGRHSFYVIPVVRECLDGSHMSDLKRYFDESSTVIIANEDGATIQELDIDRVKIQATSGKVPFTEISLLCWWCGDLR
ncbi:MAG: hypothetical protein HRT88_19910, partial [Lentisphaeraceae bacterium]|nr:hypothetical protein [Lentisphaeraceae bacterium]